MGKLDDTSPLMNRNFLRRYICMTRPTVAYSLMFVDHITVIADPIGFVIPGNESGSSDYFLCLNVPFCAKYRIFDGSY